jgi:hypothetical protein
MEPVPGTNPPTDDGRDSLRANVEADVSRPLQIPRSKDTPHPDPYAEQMHDLAICEALLGKPSQLATPTMPESVRPPGRIEIWIRSVSDSARQRVDEAFRRLVA